MSLRLFSTPEAWEDYLYWQNEDLKNIRRINAMLLELVHQPFIGIGDPVQLIGDFHGCWSRRIAGDHRLVFRVTGWSTTPQLEIIACRYHH